MLLCSISGEKREQSQFGKGGGKAVVVNNGVALYWPSLCPASCTPELLTLDRGPRLPGHFVKM